jgi:hypothetical protein
MCKYGKPKRRSDDKILIGLKETVIRVGGWNWFRVLSGNGHLHKSLNVQVLQPDSVVSMNF